MCTLKDDDFTPPHREQWVETMAAVTRNEVELPSVLRKMDVEDQKKIAESIFSLYCLIGQDLEDHRRGII
jgi:hypothetical protein